MSKETDRMVYQNDDGKWANKRLGAQRPEGAYDTQKEAIAAARQNLVNQGGGELIVKGVDGKIRSKDTIAPGNDPCPPRDTEH